MAESVGRKSVVQSGGDATPQLQGPVGSSACPLVGGSAPREVYQVRMVCISTINQSHITPLMYLLSFSFFFSFSFPLSPFPFPLSFRYSSFLSSFYIAVHYSRSWSRSRSRCRGPDSGHFSVNSNPSSSSIFNRDFPFSSGNFVKVYFVWFLSATNDRSGRGKPGAIDRSLVNACQFCMVFLLNLFAPDHVSFCMKFPKILPIYSLTH